MDEWRDIPGYEGRYQINERGQIRSFVSGRYLLNEPRLLKPHNSGNGYWTARLVSDDGIVKVHTMARIMAMTYLGIKDNQYAYHKNGCRSDWALENIGVRQRNGKPVVAYYRCRPVRKIDRKSGEVVEVYPNLTVAAKANYMTASTMSDRCKGRVKSADKEPFYFEYDDEEDRNKIYG